MKPRVTVVTLGVRDLPSSVAFYRDGLGWSPSSAGNEHICFFQLGGGLVLALYPRELLASDANAGSARSKGFAGITLAQNVPERDDVDRILREVESRGAKILKPAQDAFWGGRSGYFADPDGYAWEIAWNPHFELDRSGGVRLP